MTPNNGAGLFIKIAVLILLPVLIYVQFPTRTYAALPSPTFIINEVLYDPEGSDSGNEWIELKNISNDPMNLSGWSIQVAGTFFTTRSYLGGRTVAPGELILIGENNVPNADIISTLSFQNGGSETDGIRLKNQNNEIIDTLLYDSPNTNQLMDDLSQIAEKMAPDVSPGNSLARHSDVDTNNSFIDFRECSNPTPGEPNVFYPEAHINGPEIAYFKTTVEFDGSESSDLDGEITNWEWTVIKDGEMITQASGETFSYTFPHIGTYTVSLTVEDDYQFTHATEIEIEIKEDPENPEITSIKEAKQQEKGTFLSIEATITAPTGIPTEHEAYAQDDTAGIRLKVPSEVKLDLGKTYILSGEIDTAYSETRLDIERVFPSKQSISIRSTAIHSNDISESLVGSLITTEFTVDRRRDRYFYSEPNSKGQSTIVYLPKDLPVEIPEKTTEKTIHITGIVSRYGTNPDGSAKIRIIPRSEDEASFTSTQEVLAVSGSTISPPIILFFALLLLPVLRRISS